jgi:hypothetical protein
MELFKNAKFDAFCEFAGGFTPCVTGGEYDELVANGSGAEENEDKEEFAVGTDGCCGAGLVGGLAL